MRCRVQAEVTASSKDCSIFMDLLAAADPISVFTLIDPFLHRPAFYTSHIPPCEGRIPTSCRGFNRNLTDS